MRSLLAAVVVVAAGCASGHTATPPAARQPASTATASCQVRPGPLPDPRCTPGAVDGRVTQANIATTICKPGYTATVRPAVSYTNGLRAQLLAEYGLPASTRGEIDHDVALELGGNPTAVANLWVEPGPIPNRKDSVEGDLHRAVCAGRVTLTAAQHAIADNWVTAEAVLHLGRNA